MECLGLPWCSRYAFAAVQAVEEAEVVAVAKVAAAQPVCVKGGSASLFIWWLSREKTRRNQYSIP